MKKQKSATSGQRAKPKKARAAAKIRAATPQARKAAPAETGSEESEAKTTTNLEEIRSWVEKRGGSPATVKGTSAEHEAGLLRIDFPGYSGEQSLEHISWEDWYQKFEEKNLAFLYQEKTKDGKESRFFKLVSKK